MKKNSLCFSSLVLLMCCVFISCNQLKEKEIAKKEKEICHDYSESMTFEYKDIDKVIIYSFLNKSFIKNIEVDLNNEINYNDDVQLSNDFIKEKIVLNVNQKQDLFYVITKDSCNNEQLISGCYMPRHQIVFKDKKDNILGDIEICFSCGNFKISNSFGNAKCLCLDEMRLFLWKVGIKYFINDDHKGNKTEEESIEIKRIYNTLPKKNKLN